MGMYSTEPFQESIEGAVKNVRAGVWVLPDFQRPRKWDWQKQRSLLESLYKSYPIGSFLLWNYSNEQSYKSFPGITPADTNDISALVLDGQQRLSILTWLYISISEPEYQFSPGEIFFNASNEKFFRGKSRDDEELNKGIVSVQRLLIPEELGSILKNIADTIPSHRITDLRYALTRRKIPVQAIDENISLSYAIDVYRRVNQAGARLSAKDLTFAILCGYWIQLDREVNDLVITLQKGYWRDNAYSIFNRELILKCLLDDLFHTTRSSPPKLTLQGAKKWDNSTLTEGKVKKSFNSVKKSLLLFKRLLQEELYLNESGGLRMNPTVVACTYLRKKENPTTEQIGKLLRWFIIAVLRNRYTGGATDKKVDDDCAAARSSTPWQSLNTNLMKESSAGEKALIISETDFGIIGEKPLSKGHFVHKICLSIAMNNSATDWLQGTRLGSTTTKPDVHHIFPKSRISNKYFVDHLANLAYLNSGTNKWIKNKVPKEYLPYISRTNSEALSIQCVPIGDQRLFGITRIKEFLLKRAELLAESTNQFLSALDSGTWRISRTDQEPQTLAAITQAGEGQRIEYKETLLVDIKTQSKNKELTRSVVKAVAGMLNSAGGTVLIGVSDVGQYVGVDLDLGHFKSKGEPHDRFRQHLASALHRHLGKRVVSDCVEIDLDESQSVPVYRIAITGAIKPVPFKRYRDNENVYFLRIGPTTVEASPGELGLDE
ncbi:DUF262 domain-containing protein [Gemmatimonadota bacterium]